MWQPTGMDPKMHYPCKRSQILKLTECMILTILHSGKSKAMGIENRDIMGRLSHKEISRGDGLSWWLSVSICQKSEMYTKNKVIFVSKLYFNF